VVQWGNSAAELDKSATAGNTTYTHWGWRGNFYTATMAGLLPSTRYYYRVGSVGYCFLVPTSAVFRFYYIFS
jgi:hypothetical protein